MSNQDKTTNNQFTIKLLGNAYKITAAAWYVSQNATFQLNEDFNTFEKLHALKRKLILNSEHVSENTTETANGETEQTTYYFNSYCVVLTVTTEKL